MVDTISPRQNTPGLFQIMAWRRPGKAISWTNDYYLYMRHSASKVWDLFAKICPKRDCYYFYKDVAYDTCDIWIVQCFIKWTFDKKYSRSWLIVPAGLLIKRRPLIYTEQLLILGRLSTSQCKEICLFCFNFVSILIKTII